MILVKGTRRETRTPCCFRFQSLDQNSLRSLFFVATDEKSLSVKNVLGLDMMLPPSVFKLRILLANFSTQRVELRHNFAVLQDAWRVWRCVRQVVHEKPVDHPWKFFTAEFVTEGYIMSYVRSRASLFILNFFFFLIARIFILISTLIFKTLASITVFNRSSFTICVRLQIHPGLFGSKN